MLPSAELLLDLYDSETRGTETVLCIWIVLLTASWSVTGDETHILSLGNPGGLAGI